MERHFVVVPLSLLDGNDWNGCVFFFHSRKQCIELEQQFDFLKDLVATVPDMQGEGEDNHIEGGGEKVQRRYLCPTGGRGEQNEMRPSSCLCDHVCVTLQNNLVCV